LKTLKVMSSYLHDVGENWERLKKLCREIMVSIFGYKIMKIV